MTVREFLKYGIVYLDGGTGTLLQKAGLPAGTPTEAWNESHGEELIKIHKAYFDAGSNIVATNTFGVNLFKYTPEQIESIVKCAVDNVKAAAEKSVNGGEKFVALDVGPTGKLLKPIGDCDFESAVSSFAAVIRAGVKAGADLVLIETMNDSLETKAAVLAAKENCDLPIFVSNAYGEDGRLLGGATPEVMVAMLEGLGVDAIGVNCSFGPSQLSEIVEKYLELSSLPVILKPNAGLPRVENGQTVFDVLPEEFSLQMETLARKGVRLLGGCCGTTPEYIKETVKRTKDIKPSEITQKNKTVITSASKAVYFGEKPLLIGERINPTGKKKLREALKSKDFEYILSEAHNQKEYGADVLDVNAGAPEVDEKELLSVLVSKISAVSDLPLQIDTGDADALEKALREYNGKALINSVNGKPEVMKAVFPIVKKYGGVVVALTLDENGIPKTANGRIEIAKKIINEAKKYEIAEKDIVFDPLTMTVSAEQTCAKVTLKALDYIRNELGYHTVLGVSNVSFGLPERQYLNSVFFTLALNHGLSAAIMNPLSKEMMSAYYAYCAVAGLDENCLSYISFALQNKTEAERKEEIISLKTAVRKGLKDEAAAITGELLKKKEPLTVVNDEIIPALNETGEDFEKKKIFLPQLIMSAEAAGSAFAVIKQAQKSLKSENGVTVVLATVKGDIHDIGKNIVKLLLENYGFNVVDLGKDVDYDDVLRAVKETKAEILGLSALMTTTVPAMEKTIRLVKSECDFCKIVVGGAVLTNEYAKKIGADKYSADAMETVRFAQTFIK